MTYAAIVVGAGTLGYGIYRDIKAAKTSKQLGSSRPKETPSPEIAEEQALTASELGNSRNPGLSAAGQAEDREFSNSLDAILKGGGDPNSVAALYGNKEGGRQRLALLQEQIRMNDLNNFIGSLRERAGERQEQFGFNEWGPWADSAQANAAAKQEARGLESQGVNTIGSGVTGYLSNKNFQKELDRYFQESQPKQQAPTGAVTSSSAASFYSNQPNPGTNVTPASQTWNTPKFTPLSPETSDIDY